MIIFGYFVMCLIFGTTFLAIKIGIDAGVPPFFAAGSRFFLAGFILFLWMIWRKKIHLSLLLRKEMLFTGLGLTFGTFATLYWAEQYVTSGIAAILSATGPIMIVLLQSSVLRQKISLQAIFGCLLGLTGVTLLVLPNVSVEVGLFWVLGCIAILAGEICYASGALYAKRVTQRFQSTSPIALNAAQMMYGGGMLIVLSLLTEEVHLTNMLSIQALGSFLYLTIIGSMLGHSLFYWLVARTNPVFPSTWLYISPLIALGLGVIFYNEVISWLLVAGGLTIIIGIILVNFPTLWQLFKTREERKRITKINSVRT